MIKYILLFACCTFLFSPIAIAENSKSIYFCTRDLDAVSSFSIENENNLGDHFFAVHKNIDNPYNAELRHCFMAYATKLAEDEDNSYLNVESALGYGSEDSASRAKEGGVFPEPIIAKATVSCVPVFEEADLSKTNKKKMHEIWTMVYGSMFNEAESEEYNITGHNCCTVAYKATMDIEGHLERINKDSFNIKGMGIVWGQTFAALSGFSSSSLSSYPAIVEYSKIIFEDYVEVDSDENRLF